MAVEIRGLKDNARKTMVTELNARVADGIALSLAIKQAHWNLKGANFIAVHELLDLVRARFDGHVDVMAERVQQLDGTALGTVEAVEKGGSLKAYPTDLTKSADHIKELTARLRDFGEKIRAAIDTASDAGDEGSADIFTSISRDVDKDQWFLESHLE